MEEYSLKEEGDMVTNSPKRKSVPMSVIILIVILCSSTFGALFGFMAGGTLNMLFPKIASQLNSPGTTTRSIENAVRGIAAEDDAVISTVNSVSPLVVSVVITKDVPKFRSFGLFDFFSPPTQNDETEKKKIGGGTGFIVSPDGLIVTNKHVVDDTDAEYTVVTNDGKEYIARVLAKDPTQDIALLDIDGADFPHASLGDSDQIKIGQTAIAIGNSLGEFSNSVSKGIISGLQRTLTASSSFGETERLSGIIQTDAAINFGNSGGPLVNISGEVIGVNVARAQGADNVGFAIPINRVKNIIDQVNKTGKISTPFLGVRFVIVDAQMQKEYDLPFNYGALIKGGQQLRDLGVVPGSPADKAGVTENDIILEIDGGKITSDNQLNDVIAKHNVGDQINIKFWHKGETKEAVVALSERKIE